VQTGAGERGGAGVQTGAGEQAGPGPELTGADQC